MRRPEKRIPYTKLDFSCRPQGDPTTAYPLDANSLENPADRDGLIEASMALGNHHAFVGLHSFLVAFADTNANAYGVAHVDLRKIILLLSSLERPYQ